MRKLQALLFILMLSGLQVNGQPRNYISGMIRWQDKIYHNPNQNFRAYRDSYNVLLSARGLRYWKVGAVQVGAEINANIIWADAGRYIDSGSYQGAFNIGPSVQYTKPVYDAWSAFFRTSVLFGIGGYQSSFLDHRGQTLGVNTDKIETYTGVGLQYQFDEKATLYTLLSYRFNDFDKNKTNTFLKHGLSLSVGIGF
jgi:hypothetical protein